jgi:hypothetical protein
MNNRDNIYGTFCLDCNFFIYPPKKPEFVERNESVLKKCQDKIRDFLRRKMLGENNGN